MYYYINKKLKFHHNRNDEDIEFINDNIKVSSSYLIPNDLVVNKFNNPKNLILRSFDDNYIIPDFIYFCHPFYPIIINKNNIILNLFLWNFNKLSYEDSSYDIIKKVLSTMGGILSVNDINFEIKDIDKYIDPQIDLNIKLNKNFYLPHIKKFNFGWFGKDYEHAINYAINSIKKKNITYIELGAHYGKITNHVLNKLNDNDTVICIDSFNNILQKKIIKKNINVYFENPKTETFIKNIEDHIENKNIYLYPTSNIHKKVDDVLNDNFIPDIWNLYTIYYVSEHLLLDIINKIINNNKNAIIIINNIEPLNKIYDKIPYSKIKLINCSIINLDLTNYKKSSFILKYEENHKYITNNPIDKVVKNIDDENFIVQKILLILKERKIDEVVEYSDYVDFNKQYDILDMKNTLYHYFFFYLKKTRTINIKDKINLIGKMSLKQKIINNKNNYGLTPYEYLLRYSRIH